MASDFGRFGRFDDGCRWGQGAQDFLYSESYGL